MKNRIILGVTLALSLGLTGPAKPISETTAEVGAAVGGVVGGGAIGFVSYLFMNEMPEFRNGNAKIIIPILAGLGSGALIWWALRYYLYSLTPREKFKKAERIISLIETDSLISRAFETEDEIIRCVNARFSSNWPLVSARKQFTNFVNSLNIARDVLVDVRREVRGDSGRYPSLSKQCDELLAKIPLLARLIEDRLSSITNHKDYNVQLKLHQKHEEAERERMHQQALQYNAFSHDSWERTKDRWSNSYEKSRDRDFKQNLVNTNRVNGINLMV